MKFLRHGGSGNGYTYPNGLSNITPQHNTKMKFAKWLHAYKRKPYDWESENEILEISWYCSVLINKDEIFQFHTNQSFQLIQTNEPVTNGGLEELINATHNYLVTSYENTRIEFPILPELSQLSDDEIQHNQHHLAEILV